MRNGQCKPTCEIPHSSLDTRFASGGDQMRCLKGFYVAVRDESAVYHVDSNGNPLIVSKLVVEKPLDLNNLERFKSTWQADLENNRMIYWDSNKNPWVIPMTRLEVDNA